MSDNQQFKRKLAGVAIGVTAGLLFPAILFGAAFAAHALPMFLIRHYGLSAEVAFFGPAIIAFAIIGGCIGLAASKEDAGQ